MFDQERQKLIESIPGIVRDICDFYGITQTEFANGCLGIVDTKPLEELGIKI